MIGLIIGLILGIVIGVSICVFPRGNKEDSPIVPGMQYRHIQDQEFIVTVTRVKDGFVAFEKARSNSYTGYSMDKYDFKKSFRLYCNENQEEFGQNDKEENMLDSRAEAIKKIHEIADDNHWKMADYRLLDIRNGEVSFATIYTEEDGSLWGAIIVDDKIVVNGGTGCASASEYIVEYFREEAM